jgi:hypothetical protein
MGKTDSEGLDRKSRNGILSAAKTNDINRAKLMTYHKHGEGTDVARHV